MRLLRSLPVALAVFAAPVVLAQPSLPGCGPSGGTPKKCEAVPLDGGLSLLAIAGGTYAAVRLRRREDDEA